MTFFLFGMKHFIFLCGLYYYGCNKKNCNWIGVSGWRGSLYRLVTFRLSWPEGKGLFGKEGARPETIVERERHRFK